MKKKTTEKSGWGGPRPNSGGKREGAGRKKKPEGAKKQRSISMGKTTWAAVEAYAIKQGVNRNVAVEQLVLKGLEG